MALPLLLSLRFSRTSLREASAVAHGWALAYLALGAAAAVAESGWALAKLGRARRRRPHGEGRGARGGDDGGDDDGGDGGDDADVPVAAVAGGRQATTAEEAEEAKQTLLGQAAREARLRETQRPRRPRRPRRSRDEESAAPRSMLGDLADAVRPLFSALGVRLPSGEAEPLGERLAAAPASEPDSDALDVRCVPSWLFRAASPIAALAVFGYTSRSDAPAGARSDALVLVGWAAALTAGLLRSPFAVVEDAKRWYRDATYAQQTAAWCLFSVACLSPRIARAADAALERGLGRRFGGLV